MFVNEFFIICDSVGIDVWEFICLVNKYFCVNILRFGMGVGGYCIVVDFWFIVFEFLKEV